ncbi:capsule biosynthesis GfcC family protein [Marinomonas algarum]|uniref:Capsule biosynthesis GfcC family protein n=1 Tax=Marinomonas algarum TaxID=2883105 RepID=A0A9X1LEI5_9GAMM|nr:capsule biosynthesis GfcC family protein [Marinomonas algarum]MCB5161531.1 capsule biosynthesis GfcC family protein [Marinomonas algarum]
MTSISYRIQPLLAFFLSCLASSSMAANITLLQSKTTLTYSSDVRLSQVLQDAHHQLDYEVYPLASGLINPSKQTPVTNVKNSIVTQLQSLQRKDANRLASQLTSLSFVFFEPINMDVDKVRVGEKLDPLLKKDYSLSLPRRADHILIVNAAQDHSTHTPFQTNKGLKPYLTLLPSTQQYSSVWIIQPDRQVYYVDNIQWRHQRVFIAPGATLFFGLRDLPAEHSDLNRRIAKLLALRLEP